MHNSASSDWIDLAQKRSTSLKRDRLLLKRDRLRSKEIDFCSKEIDFCSKEIERQDLFGTEMSN